MTAPNPTSDQAQKAALELSKAGGDLALTVLELCEVVQWAGTALYQQSETMAGANLNQAPHLISTVHRSRLVGAMAEKSARDFQTFCSRAGPNSRLIANHPNLMRSVEAFRKVLAAPYTAGFSDEEYRIYDETLARIRREDEDAEKARDA